MDRLVERRRLDVLFLTTRHRGDLGVEDRKEGRMSNNDEGTYLKVGVLALPVAVAFATCMGRQKLSNLDQAEQYIHL